MTYQIASLWSPPETSKTINSSTKTIVDSSPQESLEYSIYGYSSHSASYHPQNIKINRPNDQGSRWSSSVHDQSQYITLRLERPAVLRSILFGKFHRDHVCNLKEFKIFGGLDPSNLTELLHHKLKNDAVPETFELRYAHDDLIFPVQYIKIVPLSTFGTNFNYSIWYIELNGVQEESIVSRITKEFENHKETETIRLCLKHLRQRNMMDVFHVLKNRTNVDLEHPLLSELHKYLVQDGNFEAAEQILMQANSNNIFEMFSTHTDYRPAWKNIKVANQEKNIPCPRGGHQMCIDEKEGKIYLLGGWSGKCDMADFWYYNIRENRWHLLSFNTKRDGGPGPRSCHKICFDPVTKSIFVLGRYSEGQDPSDIIKPDFYRYFIDFNLWKKISNDTSSEGGPDLVYDQQMCIDSMNGVLYVFGGRATSTDTISHHYSGLFSYEITSNKPLLSQDQPVNRIPLKSRIGHSMILDPIHQKLFIFAGQRLKECLSDLHTYSIDQDRVTQITQDYSKDSGPDPGFMQRATVDVERQEIYVLSGSVEGRHSSAVESKLWVYNMRSNQWKKVYQGDSSAVETRNKKSITEPLPRFAHQFVYDSTTKVHYLFGGNPGHLENSTERLGDFWELRLTKEEPEDVFRRCMFMTRVHKLRELCNIASAQPNQKHKQLCGGAGNETCHDTLCALDYLRTHVQPLVNHADKEDVGVFQELCTKLLFAEKISSKQATKECLENNADDLYKSRSHLFNSLLEYFPSQMKEPLGSLTNLSGFGWC
ncbi:Muskelin N-terminus-domain-containing protein [Phycomyces nitens]|nr:Muskelin N-terminus-domain-containing protein [Phycomyces nitens]